MSDFLEKLNSICSSLYALFFQRPRHPISTDLRTLWNSRALWKSRTLKQGPFGNQGLFGNQGNQGPFGNSRGFGLENDQVDSGEERTKKTKTVSCSDDDAVSCRFENNTTHKSIIFQFFISFSKKIRQSCCSSWLSY